MPTGARMRVILAAPERSPESVDDREREPCDQPGGSRKRSPEHDELPGRQLHDHTRSVDRQPRQRSHRLRAELSEMTE